MAGSKSMIIWQGHIWQDEALGVTGRKGMDENDIVGFFTSQNSVRDFRGF